MSILLISGQRYGCTYCEERFSHKNNLTLHVKFYCKKSPMNTNSLLPNEPADLPDTTDRSFTCANESTSETPAASQSPSLSACSGDDHRMTDIRFGDASFITSVTDLDVIVPETRQDEIFQLTKSTRFRKICADFK